ncbi:MAG: hypothetical protein ABSG67_03370 [Thermoguttaceae bacterium]
MRLTVGSIAASIIMAAVLVSYWPGGPARLTQNEAQAQQGEKVKASSESKQEKPGANIEDPYATDISSANTITTMANVSEKFEDNAQTRAKLEKLASAEFVDTPLSQVLDYYANNIKVQFLMDARVLSEAGITSDTPVTFNLKNVPAEMILRRMFRDLGEMTYYLDNGVIIVTTVDEADSRLETQVYRIDDLMYSPPVAKNKDAAYSPAKKPIKVDYDSLINLITSTIRPQSWDAVGGPGSICPYRGTLVISQTADVHQELQKMLKDLRLSINPDIEDEYSPSSGGMMGGGMGGGGMGGMGVMESSNKEPDKKDATQPSSDKEKKSTKVPRGGMGQF